MKRLVVFSLLSFILLFISACNFPLLMAGEKKMTPEKFEADGLRKVYSGDYFCPTVEPVVITIDEDGIATLTVTGPLFVDYINCTTDPSGVIITYTIMGIANPDTQLITFTSCNSGGYNARGDIYYGEDNPTGDVSCLYSKGDEVGAINMSISVPASK